MKTYLRSGLPGLVLLMLLFPVHYHVQAGNIRAYFSYAPFYSPSDGPYVETYLAVMGQSIEFRKNEAGKYQGKVQVLILFREGETIVKFDKYELASQELDDTTSLNFSFIDQQRYVLPAGEYGLEIQISDLYKDEKPYSTLLPVTLGFPEDQVCLSGIELVEKFTKAETKSKLSKVGYDLVPYVSNFYPGDVNRMIFYTEIYNTARFLGEQEQFLLSVYIEQSDNNTILQQFVRHKKQETSAVVPVLNEFDITDLPSGNYNLVVEIRDKSNALLDIGKLFFQRFNPRIQIRPEDLLSISMDNTFASRITSLDTIRKYIKYLEPISTDQEKYFAVSHVATSDLPTQQRFFYKFWHDRKPVDPEGAWKDYLNGVNMVNSAYSTMISEGYETDRGRVYLKYGPPNAISESYNEPGTYPYEIWHYYVLKNGQRDKRFIFFTKDLVTNDFTLIHSDVSGELSNYRWQQVIYSRVDAGFDIDQGVRDDTWGGNSKKYFDIPH
ncbi:MAG: GWxTD domain-containing protein [Bacteroidales bacterium]|nr:GWxTD domain-containing protein [Bacteroidales bacterium]